jgi:hypothetical protein
VRKLANHLAPGSVLDKKRVLAADPGAARDIGNFDDQGGAFHVDGRNPAVDDAFVGMDLGRAKPHLVGVVVPGLQNPGQDVPHLGFVVDQPQQRPAARTLQADAEDVFRSRVKVDYQQVVVNENNACAQAVENSSGIVGRRAAIIAGARWVG